MNAITDFQRARAARDAITHRSRALHLSGRDVRDLMRLVVVVMQTGASANAALCVATGEARRRSSFMRDPDQPRRAKAQAHKRWLARTAHCWRTNTLDRAEALH